MRTCMVRVLLVWTEPGAGGRYPQPPRARGGTPPLKLALQMGGWCEAWCGIRSILDFTPFPLKK